MRTIEYLFYDNDNRDDTFAPEIFLYEHKLFMGIILESFSCFRISIVIILS